MSDDEGNGYHMTPDEFRHWGHEAVEWVARYLENVESYPVLAQVEPGWVRSQLPAAPPQQPEDFGAVLADLDRVVIPATTHWQSPSFHAYFPGNSSGPSIIGDLVAAGLGVQGMLWSSGPACTEVETHVLDWLVELLGLPAGFRSDGPGGGVIQHSGSDSNLCAILAARDRAGGADRVARMRAYTSTQAHSSVEKGMRVAGFRPDQLRLVDVDDGFALRPDALAHSIANDRADGLEPFFVAATVGTTSSTAIDPVAAIAPIATEAGAWLHIDAALAGSAAVVPELRPLVNAGLDGVDSWCFDPHKWLFTNFDCSVLYVRDRRPLIQSLSVLPEYLRNAASESGAVIDYRDWHVPLGRRFRALKLWFVIRHYGAEGLAHHVREHVALAHDFARWVDDDARFERAAPAPLNLVCFRHVDGDDATQRLLDAVNRSGRAHLTSTRLAGRTVIRVSIGQTRTERRHVEALWSLLTSLA